MSNKVSLVVSILILVILIGSSIVTYLEDGTFNKFYNTILIPIVLLLTIYSSTKLIKK